MTIHDHLRSIRACAEARNWAKQFKTAREVYDNNTKINWLFWWSAKLGNINGVREAAKEIANSVSDLKNSGAAAPEVASEAAYIAYAAYVTDDAAVVTAAAAAATAYATDVAVVTAAKYASGGQRAAEAYDKQMELNMQIAKKHCPLPWSGATAPEVASERR